MLDSKHLCKTFYSFKKFIIVHAIGKGVIDNLCSPIVPERATFDCLHHSLLEAERPIPMDAC